MTSLPPGFVLDSSESIDPALVGAVMQQESQGNPNAVSPKGARGPMQIMPATASDPGFGISPMQNINDPQENKRFGADYLNAMLQRYGGDEDAALVAYNAGPGFADRWVRGGKNPKALYPETRNYLAKVKGYRGTAQPADASGGLPSGFVLDGQAPAQPPAQSSTQAQEIGGVTVAPKGQTPYSQPPQTPMQAGQPNVSVPEDVARSGLSGVERGGISLAGLPGDVQGFIRTLAKKAGIDLPPNMQLPALGMPMSVNMPSSAQLQSKYEGVRGPLYEPQTTAGEYAQTVGEFVPAAIGGPGGLARRAIGNVAVPAVVSETAGQLSKGTPIEPLARVVGGVGGGLASAKAMAPRAAKIAPPSTEELGAMSRIAYQRADESGLVVKPESVNRLVAGIVYKVKKEGIDPTIHPKATAAARRLISAVETSEPKTLQEIDTLRRVVKAAAASNDADERRIASIMVDRIDDYLANLSAKDVSAGDAKVAANSIMEARSLWARMRKAETIDEMFDRAKNATGANYTQAGMETALRQQFKALADNKKAMRGFTKEEQGAIRRVVRGGPIENVIRLIGKAAPRGVVSGGFGLGVGAMMGPGVGFGTMLTGEVARRAATALTMRNANRASDLVRSGGTQAPAVSASPDDYLATLLALEPSSLSLRGQ